MPRQRCPAWLTALAAQAAGWLLALALARLGWIDGSVGLLSVQAVTATACSVALRSERWWVGIHLLFSPLLAGALALDADPRWSAAILALLLLVFWGTLGTRVPLYLSSRAAIDAIGAQLPTDRPIHMLDLGCGTGSVLAPLARKHPDSFFHGIESAPAPWLIARLRCRRQANTRISRGDFLTADWRPYSILYAFLSPHPISAVWAKARQELGPQALLISKDFPVAGAEPERTIPLDGGGTLYIYRPGRAD